MFVSNTPAETIRSWTKDPQNHGVTVYTTDENYQILQKSSVAREIYLLVAEIQVGSNIIEQRVRSGIEIFLDPTQKEQTTFYLNLQEITTADLIDKNVYISPHSKQCGLAMYHCVVAPFTGSLYESLDDSVNSKTLVKERDGTSVSSPYVAAVATLA
ncbi:S8/S53 family peptidase [Psittacicella hinzii]|uniref:Uncharacterized protein n=1 Tax=Psittacicella hinzii TaxID=2028575 RepID=A0A3A1YAI2_9GAMM|nr:hypothetical protein [Psittacicella hinzii]RIY34675.1 hypothetical protein CKF58_07900 [Psittacicella hinzii]